MTHSGLIPIQFSIWMASKTRWAHLTKTISMPAVPRVGEFMKFANPAVGDYFPWRVSDVTYREAEASVEVATELLDDVENRGYSFEEEAEFDEYLQSYLSGGWALVRGVRTNTRFQARKVVVEEPD